MHTSQPVCIDASSYSSSPETVPIHAIFEQWRNAHEHLISAIAAYADSCTKFESACSRARLSFSENNDDLDATLLTVEVELPRLGEQQRSLANSMATLKKARNMSYTLVPVNILPNSLLLSVFSVLVDSQHAHQTHLPEHLIQPHPAHIISCVSTAWRNLTFNSPSLWSSIFIHSKDQGDLPTQLALVRAGNALLDIQVSFPKERAVSWLSILYPRCEQIRSLDLVLSDMGLLESILSIWPHDSTASSVKSLSIKIMKTTYPVDTPPPPVISNRSNDQFLQNLSRMSLYGGYFDWDSAAFRGLEDLQLVSLAGRPSPTLNQIAHILRSSPQLRTLCLGDMRIRSDGVSEASPVYLEHLCKLSIMSFAEADLCKILPLICPGTKALTLHMNYELVQGASTEAYIELFRRSKIESIYFHSRISRVTMSEVFSALPQLRHLYISRNKYISSIFLALSAHEAPPSDGHDGGALAAPTARHDEALGLPRLPTRPGYASPAIPSEAPCPQLGIIHFHDCKFKLANNQTQHSITHQTRLTIKLQHCEPPGFDAIFMPNGVALLSGNVEFRQLSATEPPDDMPFYGLNQTNVFNLAKRTQSNTTATGALVLDDGNEQ